AVAGNYLVNHHILVRTSNIGLVDDLAHTPQTTEFAIAVVVAGQNFLGVDCTFFGVFFGQFQQFGQAVGGDINVRVQLLHGGGKVFLCQLIFTLVALNLVRTLVALDQMGRVTAPVEQVIEHDGYSHDDHNINQHRLQQEAVTELMDLLAADDGGKRGSASRRVNTAQVMHHSDGQGYCNRSRNQGVRDQLVAGHTGSGGEHIATNNLPGLGQRALGHGKYQYRAGSYRPKHDHLAEGSVQHQGADVIHSGDANQGAGGADQ